MTMPLNFRSPYLLVYDFDQNPRIREYCVNIARQNDWRIYSMFRNDYCDCCFDQEGPITFVALVRDAEMIVSNSFHAMAFSLIFEKQFVVFRREEKINTRMEDLLAMLALECLLEPATGAIKRADYDAARLRLEDFVRESKAYIDAVMNGKRE